MSFRKPEGYFEKAEDAIITMQRRGGSVDVDVKSNRVRAYHQAWMTEPTYWFVLTQVDDRCTTPEFIGMWYWLAQDPVMPADDPVDHVMYVFKTLSAENKRRFLARAQAY